MQNYIKALTAQGEAASCSGTSSLFSRDALPELNQLLTAMDQAQLIPSHPIPILLTSMSSSSPWRSKPLLAASQ